MTTVTSLHPPASIRRKKTISSIFRAVGMMPIFGEPLCRGMTNAAGRGRVKKETGERPAFMGLPGFAYAAKTLMEKRDEHGSHLLPDLLARSRLAAHYSAKLADACVALGLKGADAQLQSLARSAAGYSKVGIYCVPQAMSAYERIWGGALPANFLKVMRECYPDLSVRFLKQFDDGTELFKRAKAMLAFQQVAYDGIGSFSSPSYPLFDDAGVKLRGENLILEVQLTKFVSEFCAVLFKQIKMDNDPDNSLHTDVAAATMISVSGKDVSPELTAVLLTILFPPVPLAYTQMIVERLKHPDPKRLEDGKGEDLGYATSIVMRSELFGLLKEIGKHARIEQKEKEEEQKLRMKLMLEKENTALCWPNDSFSGSEEWDEDTTPG